MWNVRSRPVLMCLLMLGLILSFNLVSLPHGELDTALALPATPDREVHWAPAWNDLSITGFFAYYCDPQTENPCTYADDRRIAMSKDQRNMVVIDVHPDPQSMRRTCWRITAHDSDGDEGPFSDELCGKYGLPGKVTISGSP